jgi:hypothetical protein
MQGRRWFRLQVWLAKPSLWAKSALRDHNAAEPVQIRRERLPLVLIQ